MNAAAIWAAAYVVDGVHLDTTNWVSVVWVAAVFGITNAIIKPILKLLSFPFVLVTLGLFTLVNNAALFGLVAYWSSALSVDGFWPAVWGALVCSIVAWFLGAFVDDDDDDDD